MIKKKVRERLAQLDEKLLGSLPSFQELLSAHGGGRKISSVDPQQRRQRTFEAIRDLLIRASQADPSLLAVEDLHWIDRTSQDFLDFSDRMAGKHPDPARSSSTGRNTPTPGAANPTTPRSAWTSCLPRRAQSWCRPSSRKGKWPPS